MQDPSSVSSTADEAFVDSSQSDTQISTQSSQQSVTQTHLQSEPQSDTQTVQSKSEYKAHTPADDSVQNQADLSAANGGLFMMHILV